MSFSLKNQKPSKCLVCLQYTTGITVGRLLNAIDTNSWMISCQTKECFACAANQKRIAIKRTSSEYVSCHGHFLPEK